MSTADWIFSAFTLAVLASLFYDNFRAKARREKMIKEISGALRRKVVIIEGRCVHCGEKIPDELLTKEDMKKPSTHIQ